MRVAATSRTRHFGQDESQAGMRTCVYATTTGSSMWPPDPLPLQAALAEFGITGVRWHNLRHFYASVCVAAGIEIRKVSRWMGHADINTTDSI